MHRIQSVGGEWLEKRTLPYDRASIQDPLKQAIFTDALRACQPIPFGVDPHTHCRQVVRFLLDALAIAFPRQKAAPVKPWMGGLSWALIRVRCGLQVLAESFYARLRRAYRSSVLIAWLAVGAEGGPQAPISGASQGTHN